MKIDRVTPIFTPITITIESYEEANLFIDLVEEARRRIRPRFFDDHLNAFEPRSLEHDKKLLDMSIDVCNDLCTALAKMK